MRNRRNGFTLIELLVVMAIIVVMVSLLMVGLNQARISAKRTQTRAEISQISEGASIFAHQMGTVPPLSGGGNGNGFRLCTKYTDNNGNVLNWPEVQALKDLFPSMDLNDNGLRHPLSGVVIYPDSPDSLDGNQALFFWLAGGSDYTNFSGFATNPRKPFAKPTGVQGEKRKGPWFQPRSLDYFKDNFGVIDGRYRDVWGTPYACLGYLQTARGYPNASCFGVSPFLDATGKPLQPNSIQVISAGPDKKFGPGGSYQPGQGAYGPNQPGDDDIANFRKAQLGSDAGD